MKGIDATVFVNLKHSIRTELQDATNEQYKELLSEWKAQRDLRREISSAKLKSILKVGNEVIITGDSHKYEVTLIKRTKFVGKHEVTKRTWDIPIAMIEEIL